MPSTSGTASDYRNLLDKLLDFIQAKATFAAPSYTGVGNGTLAEFDSQPQAPSETWTLTCSDDTKQGAANYGSVVAADTPVLHWRLGEAAQTVAEDAMAGNRDGYFGVARYWRVLVIATQGASMVEIGAVRFNWDVSGPQIVGVGTPTSSSDSSSTTAALHAFDSDADTGWRSSSLQPMPQWVGYDFGAPVLVGQWSVQARNAGFSATRLPAAFSLQFSHDAVTWTTVTAVSGAPAWVAAEIRTFGGVTTPDTGVVVNQAGLLSVDSNTAYGFPGAANGVLATNPLASTAIAGNLTLELVCRADSIVGRCGIVGLYRGANRTLIYVQDGYLAIEHGPIGAPTAQRYTDYVVAPGLSYFLAVTRDVVTKTYKMFVNGLLAHEFVYVTNPPEGTDFQQLVIGSDSAGGHFDGTIDEVAVYNVALGDVTIHAHALAAVGHEVFDIVGSVSGAQPDLVVGVAYANNFLRALVTDGATDYGIGDEWETTFAANPLGAQGWTVERRERDSVFLRGPGLAGDDAIYVSLRSYFDADADYYNWTVRGADGYDASQDMGGQPNSSPEMFVPLWNSAMPYWIWATGRHFILIARVSTTYQGCYLGFGLPIALPHQLPYPLLVGGSASVSTNRHSVQNDTARMFFSPGNTLAARRGDGSWRLFTSVQGVSSDNIVHPYKTRELLWNIPDWSTVRDDPSGVLCCLPISLLAMGVIDTAYRGDEMRLDGILAVTGFNNASENTVTVDGVDYLVVQNVYRTGVPDYACIRITD